MFCSVVLLRPVLCEGQAPSRAGGTEEKLVKMKGISVSFGRRSRFDTSTGSYAIRACTS